MEHRWGERLQADLTVLLQTAEGVTGDGCVTDISVSGAFIVTSLQPVLLTYINVQVLPSRCAENVGQSIEAQVVRQTAKGIGIEWCEFPVTQVLTLAGATCQPLMRRTRD